MPVTVPGPRIIKDSTGESPPQRKASEPCAAWRTLAMNELIFRAPMEGRTMVITEGRNSLDNLEGT